MNKWMKIMFLWVYFRWIQYFFRFIILRVSSFGFIIYRGWILPNLLGSSSSFGEFHEFAGLITLTGLTFPIPKIIRFIIDLPRLIMPIFKDEQANHANCQFVDSKTKKEFLKLNPASIIHYLFTSDSFNPI